MADKSTIEWTEATWNPLTGCTKVSPACTHCYAETFAERFRGTPGHHFEQGFDLKLWPERLDQPLRWKRPRRIFVNSMSDLFHKDVPDNYIAQVFAVMALAPQHTFQLLTKRHARMRILIGDDWFVSEVAQHIVGWYATDGSSMDHLVDAAGGSDWWPLPNVWLGVSVEDQKWANIRIPALLDTPAAVRWISAEPLLGPINLGRFALRPFERQQGGFWEYGHGEDVHGNGKKWVSAPPAQLDWVVVGGESGSGARPMHPDWARKLRDQCSAARVPFLFKQWGQYVTEDQAPEDILLPSVSHLLHGDDGPSYWRVGKKAAGRQLDGVTHDGYPAVRDGQ